MRMAGLGLFELSRLGALSLVSSHRMARSCISFLTGVAFVCGKHILALRPGYLAEHSRQSVSFRLCLFAASVEE